jgi:hypothetical protein
MDSTSKVSKPDNAMVSTGMSGKDMTIMGVALFLFFASFASLFGVSVYELVKKQPTETVLFIGEENTQLEVTTAWVTLFDFYTENIDRNLRAYKGSYRIILSSSSGVNFRVIDQDSNIIGSTVQRGGKYVENIIPFDSRGKDVSNIILQYSSIHNPVLVRMDIVID